MSTSLHTKYRPATFKQVVGHEDVIGALQKAVKANRAHVFLFHGPAGTGKTSLARILANEFCGGNATPANIEEIPAALFTGVDSMRGIADKARFKAIGASNNKIIILDEAHRLSAAAWDALLKLVEEPPAHMYFMFCTTNSGKVPKTILTRCYQVELKPLTEDEITKILKRVIKKEELDVAEDVIEAIADSAGGSPRQALQFLEACQYCESANEARKVMKQAGESKEVVDLARFLISKQGRDWPTAQRLLVALKEDNEAESVRIVLCNYLASVLLNTKGAKDATRVMSILDCFSQPYHPSEKFAPLLLSVGAALGMGE
jgi:DNA polymerase-3 subunit gamma/tau